MSDFCYLPEAPDVVCFFRDPALDLWPERLEGAGGDAQPLALSLVAPHPDGLAVHQHHRHGLAAVIDLALIFRSDDQFSIRVAQDIRIEGREQPHHRAAARLLVE